MTETARRSREFAVRLALGAQGWRVVREVMVDGLRLAAVGAITGMLASLLVMRWLAAISPDAGWPPWRVVGRAVLARRRGRGREPRARAPRHLGRPAVADA